MLCFHVAQTGKHLLRTQNVSQNKIRNIFCVLDTKFVSATNVARADKQGNICVGNNVSTTMCPRLPGSFNSAQNSYNQNHLIVMAMWLVLHNNDNNNNNNYYYYYYCYNLLLTVIMKQLKSIGPAYTTLINSPNESKYWSLENVLQSKFIITLDYCFILFAITEQPTSSPPIYNIIYRN